MRRTLKIHEPKSWTKEVMDSFILNCHVRNLSKFTISNYRSTCKIVSLLGYETVARVKELVISYPHLSWVCCLLLYYLNSGIGNYPFNIIF